MKEQPLCVCLISAVAACGLTISCPAQEARVPISPQMVVNEAEIGNPEAMADEQDAVGTPPSGKPESTWKVPSNQWKIFPVSAYLDLGRERNLSALWVFDTYNVGELIVWTGEPGRWNKALVYQTKSYMHWTKLPLDATTRYLRITRSTPACIFSEVAVDEYTPEGHQAMLDRKRAEALLAPPMNWGNWEVQHSNPPPDPARCRDTDGILWTHAINRAYTVGSPETFEAFRGPAGLAVVRHYTLNENMMFDPDDEPKLGYFVADVERAGPYCMLAEARAMAYGDPTELGYLVGLDFNRGFPEYVRDFNTAFLSLPALPSNPLPAGGKITDAATGEVLAANADRLTLSLCPCQLRALRAE